MDCRATALAESAFCDFSALFSNEDSRARAVDSVDCHDFDKSKSRNDKENAQKAKILESTF